MTHQRPVWMLLSNFYPCVGGGERQAQHLSRELIKQGWQINVLTRRHGLPELVGAPASEVVDSIPVRRLYSKGGIKAASALYLLGGFWHLIRHGRGAIYHAHGEGSPAWLAVLSRNLLGGRAVIKLRSGKQAYEKMNRSGLRRRQFILQLKLADRVIVVNSEVEAYLLSLGIAKERIFLLPNGVDTSKFAPAPAEEKPNLRTQLNLPINKKIVLYVGRLHKVKGVDVLLNSWALLPEAIRSRGQLVIVGDGPEADPLQALIDSLGIADSAVMAGMRPNVLDYYHAADLFALPSRSEGLSNALAEAMACGLPAICSALGGAADLIQEGENGFLFTPEDTHQFAERLGKILVMDGELAAVGHRARQSIRAYTDLSATLNKVQGLYHELDH